MACSQSIFLYSSLWWNENCTQSGIINTLVNRSRYRTSIYLESSAAQNRCSVFLRQVVVDAPLHISDTAGSVRMCRLHYNGIFIPIWSILHIWRIYYFMKTSWLFFCFVFLWRCTPDFIIPVRGNGNQLVCLDSEWNIANWKLLSERSNYLMGYFSSEFGNIQTAHIQKM